MPAGQPALSGPGTVSGPEIMAIVEDHLHLEGPLLPIFHAIQETYGYVPQEALPVIAGALNISRAEAHGVMSFYHDFRKAPAGRHVVKICRAEACQARGADEVAKAALQRLGLDWHATSPSGNVTIEPVFCLGLCACGPAVMVDGRMHGRVDAERMGELLEDVGA